MKCNNCGTEFEGVFCPNCGTKAEQEILQTEVNDFNAASQPVTNVNEDVFNGGDAAQDFLNSHNNGDVSYETQPLADFAKEYDGVPVQSTEDVTKKKSKKLPILVCIGSVVAVASILISVFFPYVSNFFVKTFSSPESYYKYVEGKSALALASGYSDALDTYSKNDQKVSSEISLEVSDSFKQLISSTASEEIAEALSKIDSVALVMDSNMKGENNSTNAKLKINDDVLMSYDTAYYAEDEKLYIKIPELSDKYLCYNIAELNKNSLGKRNITPQELVKALPDSNELRTLVNNYFDIAVDNVDEITKSGDALEVDGVKSNCTLLEMKISEEDATNILKGILEYAKDDKNLKKIIENFDNELKLDMYNEAEFDEAIEAALNKMADYTGPYDNEPTVIYNVWADAKGEIAGREITDDSNSFSFKILSPKNGNKVAYEISFEAEGQKIAVVGSGTENGNKLTADMNVEFLGLKLINISIEDFCMDNKEASGCVTIKTGSGLTGILQMSGITPEYVALVNGLELKLTLDGNSKESKCNLELLADGKDFVTLKTDTKISKADKIESAPAQAYNANDSAEMYKWAQSLDINKIHDIIGKYTFLGSLFGSVNKNVYGSYDTTA